jgi:hypothetical protein
VASSRATFANVAPTATAANNVANRLASHAQDCTADAGLTLFIAAIPATAAAPPLKPSVPSEKMGA